MYVSQGKPHVAFIWGRYPQGTAADVVATNKDEVETIFDTADILGQGVEFVVPATWVNSNNLPGTVEYRIDGIVRRTENLELAPIGGGGSTGPTGAEGDSAYEVAVAAGFSGTVQEWLDSLVGPQGESGAGTGNETELFFSTLSGANDDAKLANAITTIQTLTLKGVTIVLDENRDYTFTQPQTIYSGFSLRGAFRPQDQARSSRPIGNRILLRMSGGNAWLNAPAGVNTFGVSVTNLSIDGDSSSRVFGGNESDGGVLWTSVFRDISVQNALSVFGSATNRLNVTACTIDGWWNVNNVQERAFNFGGSDFYFTPSTMLLDSPPELMDDGGYLGSFTFTSNMWVQNIYCTADGHSAFEIDGSNNTSHSQWMSNCVIEGRNPSTPCLGSLVRMDGGQFSITDTRFAHAMSNPAATGRNDAGVIHVISGTLNLENVTYTRATGVSEDVPFVYASGGKVTIKNVKPLGSWTGKPVVFQASPGLIDCDDSVILKTATTAQAITSDATAGFANSGTSLVVNKPAGTQEGELLVAAVASRAASAVYTTPPAGWTIVNPGTDNTSAGVVRFYYKVAGSSEAASYTWAGGGSGRHNGVIFRVTGFDTSTVLDAAGAVAIAIGGPDRIILPAVTAGTPNTLLLGLGFSSSTGGVPVTFTGPAGMSIVKSSTTNTGASESGLTVLSEQVGASGSTGTRTATATGSASTGSGYMIAIRSTSGGIETPNTLDVALAEKADAEHTHYLPEWAGTERTGAYLSEYSTYNLKGSNTRRARAAMAKVANAGKMNVMVIQDSMGLSLTNNSPVVNEQSSWAKSFGRAMAAHLDIPISGSGIVPAVSALGYQLDSWSYTGTLSQTYVYGALLINTGGTLTYSSVEPGTSVTLYFNSISNDFTYTIDGGAPISVTSGSIHTTSGLANIPHTVTISAPTGNVIVYGIRIGSDSGIEIHNLSYGGSEASATAPTTQSWTNIGDGLTFAGSRKLGLVDQAGLTPDVVFIGLGANDINNNRALADITAGIQNIVSWFPNSDIVLIHSWNADDDDEPDWTIHATNKYILADSLDVPLIDWQDRHGLRAVIQANGLTISLRPAGTPDNVHAIEGLCLELGRSVASLYNGNGTASSVQGVDLDRLPLYVYGNSYSVLSAPWFTTGNHWTQILSARLKAGPVTSYAQSGRRIHHIVHSLIAGEAPVNVGPVVTGALWPGVSSRQGLVVIDAPHNDIGHYPAMNVTPVVPAVITSANTRYLDSTKAMYRTALALISTQTKHEQGTGTFGGTWGNQAFVFTGSSGGTLAYATTAAAYWEKSVTPPQSGPLAGKVFFVILTNDPSGGVLSQVTTTVDGVSSVNYTPSGSEQYVGLNGTQVSTGFDVVAVTVPIDGAAHTVRITHSGAGGQFMWFDCLLIPSENPNPILFGGAESPPVVHASVFSQTGVNAWRYNAPLVIAKIKEAIAEFPHAVYVPSTMTANGLYSADGVHPNDRGMAQRAVDAETVFMNNAYIRSRLQTRVLANSPDSSFDIV